MQNNFSSIINEQAIKFGPIKAFSNQFITEFIEICMKEACSQNSTMQNNWIKVTDRLPEENKEVLLFIVDEIVQGYLSNTLWKGSKAVTSNMNDGFCFDNTICKQGGNFDFVSHWQNLPSPPEQEETK